jgi:hypothetical protein
MQHTDAVAYRIFVSPDRKNESISNLITMKTQIVNGYKVLQVIGIIVAAGCIALEGCESAGRQNNNEVVAKQELQTGYTIRGEGRPLVLLHSAYMSVNTAFGKLIPEAGFRASHCSISGGQ